MFKKLFIFTLIIFAASCANSGTTTKKVSDDEMRRRSLDEYFTVTDVVTYFLPNLPTWANFSEMSGCQRTQDIRFLDIQKLHQSFNLSYSDTINMQLTFNLDIERAKLSKNVTTVPLKDEESIFFSVSDKIQSNIYDFSAPKFKAVDIIWIDPVASDSQKLFTILNDEKRNEAFPIILSSCFSSEDLKKKILSTFKEFNQNGDSLPFKYIGAEMFSVFDGEFKKQAYFSINLDLILNHSTNKTLYIPRGRTKPIGLDGKLNLKYY